MTWTDTAKAYATNVNIQASVLSMAGAFALSRNNEVNKCALMLFGSIAAANFIFTAVQPKAVEEESKNSWTDQAKDQLQGFTARVVAGFALAYIANNYIS
ncbi:MAG: hypothetical protein SNF33_06260 [Candidatus Algichlamydia australiensis]|nr:hypothetical protein [Chlamydiales bacterium]